MTLQDPAAIVRFGFILLSYKRSSNNNAGGAKKRLSRGCGRTGTLRAQNASPGQGSRQHVYTAESEVPTLKTRLMGHVYVLSVLFTKAASAAFAIKKDCLGYAATDSLRASTARKKTNLGRA